MLPSIHDNPSSAFTLTPSGLHPTLTSCGHGDAWKASSAITYVTLGEEEILEGREIRFCIIVWIFSTTNVTLSREIMKIMLFFIIDSFYYIFYTNVRTEGASLICLTIATLLAVGRITLTCLSSAIRYTLRLVERTYDVRADRRPREPLELPSRMHPYFTRSPRGLINNECITREVFVLVI